MMKYGKCRYSDVECVWFKIKGVGPLFYYNVVEDAIYISNYKNIKINKNILINLRQFIEKNFKSKQACLL